MSEKTDTILPSIDALTLPQEVKVYIQKLNDSLKKAAGENLASVIVYGSIARNRYRPRKSDINLMLLLKDVSKSELDKVADILHEGRNRFAVHPMIMTPSEINRSADVFPVKFLHIKNHHILIHGENVFEDLNVKSDHVRIRLEQELRNISIRLRNRYINLHKDKSSSQNMIAHLMPSMAVMLETLSGLCDKPRPEGNSTKAILEACAEAFSLDKDVLVTASLLRADEESDIPMDELLGKLMKTVDSAVEIVDKLEVK